MAILLDAATLKRIREAETAEACREFLAAACTVRSQLLCSTALRSLTP
jgi:hypothetical protein